MEKINRLIEIYRKDVRLVVGLMSGTSVDGVSAVLVKLRGSGLDTRFKILGYNTYRYPREVREKIFELFNPDTGSVDKICLLNFIIGEIFSEAAIKIVEEAGYNIDDIDLIGSHGQTIYHIPYMKKVNGYRSRSTLQIGEPSVIAEKTGVITIADFRPRDIAAGGQGAPISAYADYILFRHPEKTRAIQNIGGIANVTFLPKNCMLDNVLAFDTGPGNMIIDGVVKIKTNGRLTYDRDGKIAKKGKVNKKLLDILLKHKFIWKKPPKTTGRGEFGLSFSKKVIEMAEEMGICFEDLVATVTAFTAKSIEINYNLFLNPISRIDEVILGGGGVYNKTLVKMIKEYLKPIRVSRHEDYGIPEQAKEPLMIAILANEAISGNYNNVPTATGASKPVVMGKILI